MNQQTQDFGEASGDLISSGGRDELDRALETSRTLRRTYDELFSFLNELQSLQEQDTVEDLFRAYCGFMGRIVPLIHLSIFLVKGDELVMVPALGDFRDPGMIGVTLGLVEQGILSWAMDQGRTMILPIPEEDLPPGAAGKAIGETLMASPPNHEGPPCPVFEVFAVTVPLVKRAEGIGVTVALTTREPNQQEISLIGRLTSELCLLYSQMTLNSEVIRGRDRLGRIMSSFVDGVISTDFSGLVSVMTPAAEKILGIKTSMVRGRSLEDGLPRGLSIFLKNISSKADSKNGPVIEEFEVTEVSPASEVSKVPVSVTCTPLAPAGGKLFGVEDGGNLFVIRDLSESRELEKLRDLARMKDEFISNVSHELKTPLTSIIAYAEILLNEFNELAESGNDTESSRDFVQIIIKEANRLKDMINEILDIQRLELGRADFKLQVVNLSEIISECCRVLDSTAAETGCRIIESFLPRGPFMDGDRDKLKQAFINVIGNSVKYSPEGGDVEVSISVAGDKAEIEVRDHGIGISAEDLSKVFEKFFRADNSLTYEIGGTGLGLSIVKSIIEAHGGTVALDSEPGVGTWFVFTLPVREVTENEIPTRPEQPEDADPLAGLFD